MRLLILLALFCPLLSMCQPLSLKGKVINEQGDPIPGATITLKRPPTPDSQLQTPNGDSSPSSVISHLSSDAKGEFSLTNLRLDDTLVISAVGYDPQSIVYDHSYARFPQVTIWLKRRIGLLEEVVVNTGYQVIPRERATGSFTVLGNHRLNEQVGMHLLDRLPAIATGYAVVPPRTGPGEIMIRGFSTISGPKAPLVVLDNFPYEGNLANINPADVDNIVLLKDAAAASIWGARAGNGVIVITTKKGRFNQPLRVELTANATIGAKPDLLTIPVMHTSDFIDVEQFLFSRQYRFADTASTDRLPFSPVYEILFRERRGEISSAAAGAAINALRTADVRRDFARYLYQPSFTRQTGLTLRGGTAGMAWLASAGLDHSSSELAAGTNRLSLRFENTWRLAKTTGLTASAYFTHSRQTAGRPGYNSFSYTRGGMVPYTRLADAAGKPLPVYTELRPGYTDTAGGGKLLDWNFYPLEEHRHVSNTTALQDITAQLQLTHRFFSFLNLSLQYRYETQQSRGRVLYAEDSYYTRNLVNSFTQLNRAAGTATYRVPVGAILDLAYNDLQASNLRAQLNVDRRWHRYNLVVIAGSEISERKTEANNYRTYGYNGSILSFSPVDYATPFPRFTNGSVAFVPNPADFNRMLTRFVSFYTNGALTFNNRYTLSASARRDASNLFGVATNDKWTPLWSAGLAWDLSQESFYRLKALPSLKLRATYGYRGNIDPSMSALTTISYSSNSPYTQTPTARVNNFYNPDLRWERVGMLNLGLDFALLQSRITGSLEHYRKKATDLYGVVPVDITTGLGVNHVTKNVASLRGQGWDLELNTLTIPGPVRWTSQLSLSRYTDRVTAFYNSNLRGSSFVGGGSRALLDYPLFSFFAYRWAGLDGATGDPIGIVDGKETKDYNLITGSGTQVSDLAYLGSSFPTLYGSLGNTLSWKGWSLTARLTYKFGYSFLRESISYNSLFANARSHSDFALRWQRPGDEQATSVPSMVYPGNAARDAFYTYAEVLATRGGHIRLQYLNLSWESSGAKKKFFDAIRVFAVANNLGILWRANRQGLDPDYPATGPLPPLSVALGVKLVR